MSKLLELVNKMEDALVGFSYNAIAKEVLANLKEYEWRQYLDEINGC